jgi:hypothetical protein
LNNFDSPFEFEPVKFYCIFKTGFCSRCHFFFLQHCSR